MSRKKLVQGRTTARLSAMTLGLLPVAAMAFGGPDSVAGAPAPGCANPGATVITIPLEPQPEALKGAPYSAVGTTEVVTSLADGNRITRTNTMRYFRDGAGRMRTEYQLSAIGPFVPDEAQSIVTITDPIAGKRYVLHPSLKRADVFPLVAANGSPAPAAGAIFVGGAFANTGGMVRGSAPAVGFGASGTSLRGSMDAPGTSRIRVGAPGNRRNVGTGTGALTLAPPPSFNANAESPERFARGVAPSAEMLSGADVLYVNPRVVGAAACGTANAGKVPPKPVSIGERRIEGLKVTGSRLEFTIDAGAVGNDQPITVRNDQWFSQDLGVVVSSTNNDPLIGDTTYRLEQIHRVEPDPQLFVVPEDYAKSAVGN